MATVTGEFPAAAQAERAVAALKAAGARAEAIRVWNIIPAGKPPERGSSARAAGALAGALLGGVRGYVAGKALGSVLDQALAEAPPLPDATGVRIVVEVSPSCPDPASVLRGFGATNVR